MLSKSVQILLPISFYTSIMNGWIYMRRTHMYCYDLQLGATIKQKENKAKKKKDEENKQDPSKWRTSKRNMDQQSN